MSHTPNELSEEFPDRVDQMSALKQSDAHFSKLFDDYHEINRAIHRAETDVEPTDDLHMAEMRKQRLALKDEIWAILLAQDKV
ncbi:YdcH family protein [Profundibacter sp.]